MIAANPSITNDATVAQIPNHVEVRTFDAAVERCCVAVFYDSITEWASF